MASIMSKKFEASLEAQHASQLHAGINNGPTGITASPLRDALSSFINLTFPYPFFSSFCATLLLAFGVNCSAITQQNSPAVILTQY